MIEVNQSWLDLLGYGREEVIGMNYRTYIPRVEAMASYRPYRPAMGVDVALEEIEKNRGTLYDEAVVDACQRLFRGKGYRFAEG